MSNGYWAAQSDRVLEGLFADLPRTTSDADVRAAVRDAYPFGPREHWPYKAWLARVAAWTAAWRAGQPRPLKAPAARHVRPFVDDGATLELGL